MNVQNDFRTVRLPYDTQITYKGLLINLEVTPELLACALEDTDGENPTYVFKYVAHQSFCRRCRVREISPRFYVLTLIREKHNNIPFCP